MLRLVDFKASWPATIYSWVVVSTPFVKRSRTTAHDRMRTLRVSRVSIKKLHLRKGSSHKKHKNKLKVLSFHRLLPQQKKKEERISSQQSHQSWPLRNGRYQARTLPNANPVCTFHWRWRPPIVADRDRGEKKGFKIEQKLSLKYDCYDA